jgi:hypothetical protein
MFEETKSCDEGCFLPVIWVDDLLLLRSPCTQEEMRM